MFGGEPCERGAKRRLKVRRESLGLGDAAAAEEIFRNDNSSPRSGMTLNRALISALQVNPSRLRRSLSSKFTSTGVTRMNMTLWAPPSPTLPPGRTSS